MSVRFPWLQKSLVSRIFYWPSWNPFCPSGKKTNKCSTMVGTWKSIILLAFDTTYLWESRVLRLPQIGADFSWISLHKYVLWQCRKKFDGFYMIPCSQARAPSPNPGVIFMSCPNRRHTWLGIHPHMAVLGPANWSLGYWTVHCGKWEGVTYSPTSARNVWRVSTSTWGCLLYIKISYFFPLPRFSFR